MGMTFNNTLNPPQANVIINGNFSVNQRLVSGSVVLAAGAYGHDRWKAGASGCTYTFATSNGVTTITISAGSLIQTVEGTNLESGTYVLSWTGTSQGKIGGGSYGASGITASLTGGTNFSVEFNTGTVTKVRVNAGSTSFAYQPRDVGEELTKCLRFNRRLANDNVSILNCVFGNGFCTTTAIAKIYVPLGVRMRTLPVLTSSGSFGLNIAGTIVPVTSISIDVNASGIDVVTLLIGVASGLTAGHGATLFAATDANAYLNFNAEL